MITTKRKHPLVFFLFVLPALFAFTFVIGIPFILGIYYSFTNWNAITGTEVLWVGLQNYFSIFRDVTFLHSFIVTTIFTIMSMILINFVAFSLALLVTNKLKFVGVYQAGFFLPNLIGGIILGYIWQFVFNNVLPSFGELTGIQWFMQNPFLANRNLSLLAIVIVRTWQYAGYIMMIYVAAIQSVSSSLLEAAQIDGTTYLQRVRYILLPLIAPAFTVSMFLTLVTSFNQFDVNIALTAGGPSGMFMGRALATTELLSLNIYNTAFVYRELAQGQAKSIIFFIVLAAVGIVQVYFNKRKELTM